MTFAEIEAKLKNAVYGVRKAIYGIDVREDIASGMEMVLELARTVNTYANNAKTSEENAANSAASAKFSEENAASSMTAAKRSESNAANSASAAKSSEDNALDSAIASRTSEENAKASADRAAAIVGTDKSLIFQGAAADSAAVGVHMKVLEIAVGSAVDEKSFIKSFDNLTGITLDGVWNESSACIEF